MSKYVIKKGSPCPPRGVQISVLEQMEVGDSFYEANPRKNWRMAAALRGMKLSQRKEGDGVRIWRVS